MESITKLIHEGLEHINRYLANLAFQTPPLPLLALNMHTGNHSFQTLNNGRPLPSFLLSALQLADALLETTTWEVEKVNGEWLLTQLIPLAESLQHQQYDLAGVALSHACLYLAETKYSRKVLIESWLKLNTAFLQNVRANRSMLERQDPKLVERILLSKSDPRLTLLHDYLRGKAVHLPQWLEADEKLFHQYLRLEKLSAEETELHHYQAELTRLEHQFLLASINRRFLSVEKAPSSLLHYVPYLEQLVEQCLLRHEESLAAALVGRFKAWAKTPKDDAALLQLLLRLHQTHWQSAEREPYWHAYRRQLKEARQTLQQQASVFPAERYQQHVQYSRAVHALLKAMLTAGVELLALSNLSFSVVLFGSAARDELLPYSDIEAVILISDEYISFALSKLSEQGFEQLKILIGSSFALSNLNEQEFEQLNILIGKDYLKFKSLNANQLAKYKKIIFTEAETDSLKEILGKLNTKKAKVISEKLVAANDYPKFKQLSTDELANYQEISFTEAEIRSLKEKLGKLNTKQAKILSAKLIDMEAHLQPLLKWWQWMMDALNESDEDGSGLQFDDSFSPLKQLLTPEELAARCSLDSDAIQSGFALSNLQTKYLYGDEDLYAAFAHAREQRLAVQVILGEHTPNVLAPGDNLSGSRNPATPASKPPIDARDFFKDPAWKIHFPSVDPAVVIPGFLHQVLATLAYANQPAVFERQRKKAPVAPGHINLKDSIIKPLLYASMDIALALHWIPFPSPPEVFNRLAQHYPAWATFAHVLEQAYYAVQALRTELHFQSQHQVDTFAFSHSPSPAISEALNALRHLFLPALFEQCNALLTPTPLAFLHNVPDPLLAWIRRDENVSLPLSAPRWQLLLQLTIAWHLPAHVQAPYYQALTEEEKEAYLDALAVAGCPIDDVARLPNPAGYRQRERLVWDAFQRALNGITLPKDTPLDITWPREVDVTVHFPGETTERRLHPLIANTLIDKTTGNIIKQFQGRHPVAAIDYGGDALHIKQKPDHPMMDYAIFLFKHRLCGHSAVPSTLAKLTVTDPHGKKSSYPVLLAASIGTLADNLARIDASELQQCRVAPSAFTSAVLADLMLRPGDGALRNYQRTAFPSPNGEDITFVCIDNDQHFFEPLVDTKEGRKLCLRSLWLCMDQMNNALDRDTLEAFCQLNPHAFLYQWLQKLIEQNKLYKALYNKIFALSKLTVPEFERLKTLVENDDPTFKLFNAQPLADHTQIAFKKAEVATLKNILQQLGTPEAKTLRAKLVDKKEWEIHYQADAEGNRFVPHFLLKEGCIAQLALDMVFLQGIIRTALKLNEPLSGATLLEKFNIRLYRYYAAFFNSSTSFAFSRLSTPEFKQLKTLVKDHAPSFKRFNAQPLANYTQIAVEKADVAMLKETLHRLGTSEAKILGAKLVSSLSLDERFSGVTQQSIVSASSSQTLQAMLGQVPNAETIKSKEFKPKQSINELGVIDPSLFSDEVVMSNDNRIVQANFAHLCLTLPNGQKIPDGRRQRVILQSLLYPTYHYQKLVLQHASALDDTLLLALLEQSPQLTYLDIRQSINITDAVFQRLPTLCPQLHTLYVSANSKMIHFARSTLTGYAPLIFQHLQLLHVGCCGQLQRLQLEAPQLQQLKVNACRRLKLALFKVHMPALAMLDIRHHPTLTDSDLPVMLSSVTALQQLRLEGCTAVQQRSAWEKYPVLATVPALDKASIEKLIKCWAAFSSPLPANAIAPLRLMFIQYQQDIAHVLPTLLKLLKYDDERLRREACQALGELGHASEIVIQALLKVCQDKDIWDKNMWVRRAACQALGQLGHASEPVIQALTKVCQKGCWWVRQAACRALGQLGHASEGVIQALLTACQDNEYSGVRQAACQALGQLRQASESVVQVLLKACQDKDNDVRQTACQALGQLGHASESVIQALLTACQDYNSKEEVRQAASQALGQLGHASESVLQALIKACQDKDNDVRQAACQALGQLGHASESVLQVLLTACQDDYLSVREAACRALGQLGHASESVIQALLTACQDNDWLYVREAACQALGELGHASESVIQALLKACYHYDKDIREAACQALGQLGHASESVLQALIEACQGWNSYVRRAACQALRQLGHASEGVLQALIKACQDDDWQVCRAACQALGQLGHASESVIQALLKACYHYDKDIRQAACQALGQLGHGSEGVIQALIKACQDDKYSSDVRPTAYQALRQLGEPVIQALLSVFKGKDWVAQEAAVCALGQLLSFTLLLERSTQLIKQHITPQETFVSAKINSAQTSPLLISTSQTLFASRQPTSPAISNQEGKAIFDPNNNNRPF